MRIQKIGQTGDNIQGTKTHNKSFTAGKVNLYSDFDGTYIPAKFNHDSVCNYAPPVNKGEFKSYFDKIWELFGKLRGQGEENKFNFVITTGRNLTETNYFLNKLKQQDLWVPLPEKLVTCNGQDEFYKNVKTEEEFYRTEKEAFVKENANEAKREYYKSKGWDYTGLMSKLKELLSKKYYEREIEFLIGSHPISQKVKDFLRLTNDIELEKLLNEINTVNTDENGIRKILESKSRVTFPDLSGIKNDFTLGYADIAGFRLGTSRCVRWIDPSKRAVTNLTLCPLTIMDCTLMSARYQNLSFDAALAYCREIITNTASVNGEISLLWHNDSFTPNNVLHTLYEQLLQEIGKHL